MKLLALVLTIIALINVSQTVEITGYLTDKLCWDMVIALDGANMETSPEDHTVYCALYSPCLNSGYLVITRAPNEEKYTVNATLSAQSNDKAVTFLKGLSTKDNIYVTIVGETNNNLFDVTEFIDKSNSFCLRYTFASMLFFLLFVL